MTWKQVCASVLGVCYIYLRDFSREGWWKWLNVPSLIISGNQRGLPAASFWLVSYCFALVFKLAGYHDGVGK